MLEHAAAAPAEEVCGLLGGRGARVSSYHPVPNAAPDRARRYLMDPVAQIAAMKRLRETGEELLGIFHSHPFGPAAPSEVDRELAAYPGTVYFIASLEEHPPRLEAWRYDGEDFTPVRLSPTPVQP